MFYRRYFVLNKLEKKLYIYESPEDKNFDEVDLAEKLLKVDT